ncbi:TCP-1/cpn60 chaperonin family protein [compost metagenome]
MNLWRPLNEYSLKIFDSKIQIVIRAFAEALLVIPRQLLASVCKVQDIEFEMSKLKALYRSQQNESNDNQTPDHWLPYGVDVTLPEGGSKICNVLERGIIDSVQTKKTMIQLAAEACVMILRIDETIHPA